ncbi:hypothetical protein [Xanthomonas citri]|uniref:hypothetical protein n=1 Tax=Xanthomonas citri TaxID=346 RepID=UPI0012FDD6F1|nr:hypothetical protein [Xanthomonas citri]
MRKLIERLERHACSRAHRLRHPSRALADDRARRHAQNFSPSARQTLTNDSRQKSGAVQVGEHWTRVGPLLSTYRIDMRQHHCDPRPTFPFLRFRWRLARHRCTKIRITDRRRAQKNGRSMSGHRMQASTTPDQ